MKIMINGEAFGFDFARQPMSEALQIEQALGMRFTEFQEDLQAGSIRAIAAFVWQVLHRNGRDVSLEALLSGEHEVELMEVLESMQAAAAEIQAQEPGADPTGRGDAPRTATGGTPSTATSTSRSSRSTTASGPGR